MISLAPLATQLQGAIDHMLERLADQSVQRIQASLSVAGGSHYHAPPGEPPYMQTGRLEQSIKHSGAENGEVTIYSDAEHALYQELGTRTIQPRPFMGPEMERLRERLLKDATRQLRGTL